MATTELFECRGIYCKNSAQSLNYTSPLQGSVSGSSFSVSCDPGQFRHFPLWKFGRLRRRDWGRLPLVRRAFAALVPRIAFVFSGPFPGPI